jgi:hypothetical protein
MYSVSGGGLTDNFLQAGYHTLDEEGVTLGVYPEALPYLDNTYTEEYLVAPFTPATGTFRDILDNERGIHLPFKTGFYPWWNYDIGVIESVKTAFSWSSLSASGTLTQPTIPVPWVSQEVFGDTIYEALDFQVIVGYRVAVVYGGAVGDVLHPDNRFFLEISCRGDGYPFVFQTLMESGFSSTSATYTMRLSTGDLTMALCCTDPALSGNITHEAVSWFPYQDKDGSVWNPATGLPA